MAFRPFVIRSTCAFSAELARPGRASEDPRLAAKRGD
jgi:hypothetical protein